MIEACFNEIAEDGSNWFRIIDSAQIEPADPLDPQELYRMRHQDVKFDAVFYPDRVEIQDTETDVLVQEISNDRSKKELERLLENAVHQIRQKF